MHWGLVGLLCAGGLGALGPSALAADAATGRPVLKAAPSPAGPGWTLCHKPAAGPAANTFPDVPGDGIFGFTSPTDVGNPGDCAMALEYSGRAGKADGRYDMGTLKTEFSATIAENLFLAVSPFATYHRIEGVSGLDDLRGLRFNGLSGELSYRFIERSAANRVAATFSVEPRWARVDGTSGLRATTYWVEFKLFLDSVVVADRLYAAVNLNYAPAIQKLDAVPPGEWVRFSGTNASAALAYQVSDRLFAGAEIRHVAAFQGAALERKLGEALLAGPTLLVKFSNAAALNVVWTPQLWGRAAGANRGLDLDNFERQEFRAKLATSF
jgi:hypothetical protein